VSNGASHNTKYTKLKVFSVTSATQIRASAMFLSLPEDVTIDAVGAASNVQHRHMFQTLTMEARWSPTLIFFFFFYFQDVKNVQNSV